MKASTSLSSVLLASCLTACSLASETPPPLPSPYTELPARTSTLSGVVIDPEAFFFLLANWPSDPEHPEFDPPPALYDGVPFLFYSSVPEATIRAVDATGAQGGLTLAEPTGSWQMVGVPSSGDAVYQTQAEPPARGVVLGEAYMDPEAPPPPVTAPPATYFKTTTLRPIAPTSTLCQLQLATMVGDGGALSAIASTLTMEGRPTTVADLLNPSKTGGVALLWVYAPSFELDIFMSPSGGISAKASRGTLFSIDWAPPEEAIPGQSPMGYLATPVVDPSIVSSLGYYAVVLPAGDSGGPVTVTFKDEETTPADEEPGPFGPRPWIIPPAVEQIGSGVSFGRVFAVPSGGGPEEDPLADPMPFPPSNSQCYPEPPQE